MTHEWNLYFDTSSEYWEKVQKIYKENDDYPKIVVKNRNLHHKFPKSFSKKDGVEIDNDKDNLVSLALSDHFLVHYYLWKCSLKGYRHSMSLAFSFMRRKLIKYASDETIEQLAKDYDALRKEMSEVRKGKHLSEEHKRKISESMQGGNSTSWKKGHTTWNKGKKMSEETRRKNSEAHKDKHPSEETRRKKSELMKGRPSPLKGNHLSEETRKKMSEVRKGTHWFNNGKINIRCFECPEGFTQGKLHSGKEK